MSEMPKNTEETHQDERTEEENDEGEHQQQPEKVSGRQSQTASQPKETSSRQTSFLSFKKLKNFIVAPVTSQPKPWGTPERNPTRQNQQPPRPPPYYANTYGYQSFTAHYSQPQAGIAGQPQLAFFQNPIIDFSYWAPYPSDIPEGIPPGLAHLISVDSIIIMQQINMIELFIDVTQTCTFMVLNSEGLCIFYAYETSTYCARCCCGDNRPLQIHVKDMYQNEIIYMNRLCSCNDYCSACCCLTALEVYSMPFYPIGAVIQKCYLTHVQFDIVDVDENVMFKIIGPPYCKLSSCCIEVEFTIHALDPNRTEIGLIRKQWGGIFRESLSTADVFTISFPKDLDVKIKAIFLGAMFLINYVYFQREK